LKNLFQRTISGIVYLVIVIGSLFLGKYAFGALFLAVSLLALTEYYNISGYSEFEGITVPGLLTGAATFIIFFLSASGMIDRTYISLVALSPVVLMIAGLYMHNNHALKDLSGMFVGFLYISLPLALTTFLVFPSVTDQYYTHRIFMGLLILVWINDTGAYVTGMLLGKHRLFLRISPKKSWEGLVGGTLFTLIAAFFMTRLMGILDQTDWIVLAVIVCIFGVYGDLAESLIKRNAKVKDSGTIIPGHGGVLDRFDSVLFVVPVAVVYLMLKGI